jgi:hypothetical protein
VVAVAALSDRVFLALVRPGDEAVERYRDLAVEFAHASMTAAGRRNHRGRSLTSLTRAKEKALPTRIEIDKLQQLLAEGAQLVEVLPPASYAKEHLVGARNIPLKQLDAETAAQLDSAAPVVVYCYDYL